MPKCSDCLLPCKTAWTPKGTFVAENNVVSQSVPHLHVHVVPRRRKDGLRGFFWPRGKYANDAEMEAAGHRDPRGARGRLGSYAPSLAMNQRM